MNWMEAFELYSYMYTYDVMRVDWLSWAEAGPPALVNKSRYFNTYSNTGTDTGRYRYRYNITCT